MKGTVAATVLEYGTSALNIDACRLALADEGEDARLGGSGVWGTDKMAKNVYEGGYAGIPVTSSEVGRWPANVLLDEDAAQFLDEHSGNELVGASRFYYVPKASRAERNAGIDSSTNVHPTVKPIDLMRWVVRLVTPPGGTVLDPFMGSGTTPIATLLEGFNGVGIEREAEYMEIARLRLKFWQEHGDDGLRIVREQEASEARREAVAAAGQLSLL
jgi:site-specific DNA-methyltransferase (adenine-specific)